MTRVLLWLGGGDLRSDGSAPEVTRMLLADHGLLDELLGGLSVDDDVIRGRAADVIEHFGRKFPEELVVHQALIVHSLTVDPVAMVRWHMAMLVGHMALCWSPPGDACKLLVDRLADTSVFVASWSIVSLCIFARNFPELQPQIIHAIAELASNPSAAIRSKVRNAQVILGGDATPFPAGWVKGVANLEAIKDGIND